MTTRRAISLLVLAIVAGGVAGQLTDGGPGALALVGLTVLAIVVSAFLPAGRGSDASPVGDATAKAPQHDPPRRRPIAPPPTRGRWDEAPRA